MNNLRTVSEDAIGTVHDLDAVIATNAPLLGISASNIVTFSSQISSFANELNGVLSTNNGSLSVSMDNIKEATESLKGFADDLHTGKGLVGALVKNPAMATDFGTLISNLSITSSNLNRHGIWGIMWSHKPGATNAPAVK
jgi:ABC-type transporter Mla subunit MlaD